MIRKATCAALLMLLMIVVAACEVDTQEADDNDIVEETAVVETEVDSTPSPTPEPTHTPVPQPTPTATAPPEPVNDESSDDDPEVTAVPQESDEPSDDQLAEIAGEIDVQVRGYNYFVTSFGTLRVFGELENHGDGHAEIREILITLRDADGAVMNAGTSHTYISVVEPGEVVPFQRIFTDTSDDFEEIEIEIDARDPDDATFVIFENYRSFEALQGDWREGEWGNSIVGEIENVGEYAADLVEVFAVGYDEDSRIQFVETSFAERDTIHPGERSPFTIDFLDDSLVEPAEIRIFAEGWKVEG